MIVRFAVESKKSRKAQTIDNTAATGAIRRSVSVGSSCISCSTPLLSLSPVASTLSYLIHSQTPPPKLSQLVPDRKPIPPFAISPANRNNPHATLPPKPNSRLVLSSCTSRCRRWHAPAAQARSASRPLGFRSPAQLATARLTRAIPTARDLPNASLRYRPAACAASYVSLYVLGACPFLDSSNTPNDNLTPSPLTAVSLVRC